MDQLTYDLRHLKTGFSNYQHRKMMRVCDDKIVFCLLREQIALKLQVRIFLFQQEQEEREREELLNRRFTTVSCQNYFIITVLMLPPEIKT